MKLSKVQETLLFPLVGRYRATEKWPEYFNDKFAKDILSKFGDEVFKKELSNFSNLSYGLRYKMNVILAKEYLGKYPGATVVNLGAGLDSLYEDIDNGKMNYYSLDLPEVIELRKNFCLSLRKKKILQQI